MMPGSAPGGRVAVLAVVIGEGNAARRRNGSRIRVVAGPMMSARMRSAQRAQLCPLFAREVERRDDLRLLQGLHAADLQGDLCQASELRGRENRADGRFVGPPLAAQLTRRGIAA